MKMKWALFTIIFTIATVLTGCDNPLMVLDPKGPAAQEQANVIMISIWTMAIIVLTVIVLYVIMLVKYRASKQSDDYEPPHIEGSKVLETIWVVIPIVIVIFLSVVTVKSLNTVEAKPEGYKNQEPLVIYAASSNWKWHFSYPEEDIETVNYLFIPTNRPIEFKLYSYGPISSFWIPQLGGQKYAMSDMVNTLHLAADAPGEYMGRNANFSGAGFAQHTFNVKAMPEAEYEEWVSDIKKTAKPITEDTFNKLLEPGHVGQSTYTGTHLDFSPAPEGEHAGHNHGSSDTEEDHSEHEEHAEHEEHSEHNNH
ncbi:cytochrome aa3 quinol oxidase subunit II [Bacillus massiliglaciei]|uniref:cytochrome aa3 quinol oxidase subunit II n=1 Tax=Bacillus massiliglaciei TaxID=1816693 RepID=UPI000AB289DA|nr:cytochrome aa3 quinol oxidase subunit II [Bacillus massiliglaciei]